MKLDEIRKESTSELEIVIQELKQKNFALRFQKATGQLEAGASNQIRQNRKTIARILTIISERKVNGQK